MKMLIVDDDLANCQLIEHIVQPYGESVIAADGDRAVTAFIAAHKAKNPFEIIFLDIMMPIKDGHQVLKEIRAWEEKNLSYGEGEAKIVMISALDSKDHILSSFKEGCEYYLVKPVSRVKVEEVLTEMGY
ncbi:response regulator [bacterium]|nr:response regulator [bacterium]